MNTDTSKNIEQRRLYLGGLNTYYKLKTSYEEAFQKETNKIINLKGLSWKEKRLAFKLFVGVISKKISKSK